MVTSFQIRGSRTISIVFAGCN